MSLDKAIKHGKEHRTITITPRTEAYILNPLPEAVPAAFARELEVENQKMKAALTQIFAWWDAADGTLVTHYPSSVTPKMREFRSLANNQDHRPLPDSAVTTLNETNE